MTQPTWPPVVIATDMVKPPGVTIWRKGACAVTASSAARIASCSGRANPRSTSFEDAILCERSYGTPARWQADYAWYARAKTRLAWREQIAFSPAHASSLAGGT